MDRILTAQNIVLYAVDHACNTYTCEYSWS